MKKNKCIEFPIEEVNAVMLSEAKSPNPDAKEVMNIGFESLDYFKILKNGDKMDFKLTFAKSKEGLDLNTLFDYGNKFHDCIIDMIEEIFDSEEYKDANC